MCTAISFNGNGHFFGRNLDLERGYGERVVITPRNYNFKLRCSENLVGHYAMIGMAAVSDGYPLYFDAANEKGLCVAGLNFPNNAVYHSIDNGKINITPFEFIPFVLGKCKNINEAEKLLYKINIVNINYSESLLLSPLHWIISDGKKSLTVESVAGGLKIYENKVGVLTNNPPFLKQLENLEKYRNVFEAKMPENNGSPNYSLGLDGVGIPGDFSSQSRFVKAAFIKHRSPNNFEKKDAINHFFHILTGVAMPKGCVLTPTCECEYTRYTCCIDTENGDYYYNTYDKCDCTRVSIFEYNLDGEDIFQTREI